MKKQREKQAKRKVKGELSMADLAKVTGGTSVPYFFKRWGKRQYTDAVQ